MLHQVSEKTMHRIRWGLAIAWLLLIASLFYDPISSFATQPGTLLSPFHVNPDQCVRIRETCLPQTAFSMGAMIWWAMIVPAGIFIILVFGHEFWRRICPLSFMSQIPRALGIQRRRSVVDPVTGKTVRDVVAIADQSWLGRNHLYVQFGLFILGLWLRILFTNSNRIALGSFLIITICSAILVGYLYAGKSWCHYFCPMAPVQLVYTGPRSLLGSKNYEQSTPTHQSMCRTVAPETGREQSACVGCKAACFDIDAEKTYWTELHKPGRRLVQYGYLGMVIAFFGYYFLYAGNWDYYFSGIWSHEPEQISKLLDAGFYLAGQTIPIPKVLAVGITFAIFITVLCAIGVILERLCRRFVTGQGRPLSAEQAQHRVFTLFTVASFWTFFSYGARPALNHLPYHLVLAFNALIVLVGSIWLYRTFKRTRGQYERESVAVSLRRHLHKLPIHPEQLGGRQIDELTPNEIYTLVKVLQGVSHQLRLQTYRGVVLDLLKQQTISVATSLDFCRTLRQDLQLKESDHFDTLEAIAATDPEILASSYPARSTSLPHLHEAVTVATTVVKFRRRK